MNCCVLTPESVAETIMAPWTFDGQLTVHAVVLFWTKISVINSPLVRFVNVGEIVLQFDTTDQAFKLKESEADLAEAEQQVLKAQADGEAQQEENNYQLIKAKADVRQAELDCRKNRMLSAIVAL